MFFKLAGTLLERWNTILSRDISFIWSFEDSAGQCYMPFQTSHSWLVGLRSGDSKGYSSYPSFLLSTNSSVGSLAFRVGALSSG